MEQNQIGRLINNQNGIFIVFEDEDTAEKWKHLFPNYIQFVCFGGYMNALKLA